MRNPPKEGWQGRINDVHPLPPGCSDYADSIESEMYVRLRTDRVGSHNQVILNELDEILFRGTLERVSGICEQSGRQVARFYRYPPPYYASEVLYVPLIFLVPETKKHPVAAPG